MNETIGVKGGYQDRRRSLKIKKEALKRLQEQSEEEKIRELENIVKKDQLLNVIRFVPFLLLGKLVSNKEAIEKEYTLKITPIVKEEKEIEPLKVIIEPIEPKTTGITIEQVRKVDELPIRKISIEKLTEKKNEEPEEFPFKDNYKPNFNSIQNNKIIEEYQKQLKSIRKDLKTLTYEYKVIDNAEKNVYTSKEADELLVKLNTLIAKLDKLKSKYSIDKIDRYDQNYICVLIDDYIKEFRSKNFVKEIKNSDLYILISEKIEELYQKKEELENKITNKKNKLLLNEEEIEILKEKYDEFDKFNIMLLEFQNEQDKIIKEMNEQLEKATTIEEKIEIRVKAMDKQSKKLLTLIGLQLLLPIPQAAKRVVTSTALYMYYMKRMIKPELETKQYRVVKVEDYSNAIEKNINVIEDIEKKLNITIKEIDKIINNFKTEFREYLGNIKQCDDLIHSLEKIKYEIKDKEEDIKSIKLEHQKNLEKNNSKVKKYNNIIY